ncbi:chemotaxis protein CheW [Duganella radicis]|uniref:Chemotaxis protein CheW n=1 Tax=Duganella radicis TaxID=551988 RepID=A0A6L6PRQ6_9BURK|nr:chemotaxis protein CheW [Duganella radicis]MTV41826.1 chemotaxis protein CheW [Duganella radicis]
MDAASTAPGGQQYLTFMLGSEVYALGILGIKEIIEYGELTTVPCLPAFIRGVINLRGAVVPVIDLAARFGRQASAPTRRTCVVIVEARADDTTHDIGIMVDAVNAVLEIPPAQIEPPPAFGATIRADFIAGMGKLRERFVILLDSDRLLAVDELAQLAGAGA